MAAGQAKPKKKVRLNIGEKQGYTSNLTGERTPATSGSASGKSPFLSGAIANATSFAPRPSSTNPNAGGSGSSGGGGGTGGSGESGGSSGDGGYYTGSSQTNTAFGDRFTPGMYQTAYADPTSVLNEYFRSRGLSSDGGLYATMRQQVGDSPLEWMLSQGNKTVQGYGNYLDWFGKAMDQKLTPGGNSLGNEDIARMFIQAGTDPNSVLGLGMTKGSTYGNQVSDVMSTLRASLDLAGIPPEVAAAFITQAGLMADQYKADGLTGRTTGANPADDPFLKKLIESGLFDQLGR